MPVRAVRQQGAKVARSQTSMDDGAEDSR